MIDEKLMLISASSLAIALWTVPPSVYRRSHYRSDVLSQTQVGGEISEDSCDD